MLKVCKFGGSSLAGAAEFLRVRDLVAADVARRVVVVSAPGRRHPDDQKITDLLYLCHAHLRYGVPCWELWRRVCERFLAIRDGCGLHMPLEQELESIYASLNSRTEEDFLASRGEYLAARLMAELLGFAFVDAAEWLRFDYDGQVREEESYALLASLADGRKIVTPGFYGTLPDGRIHTFPRGGSDVTGALAAAALRADVYENWTDVPGVLTADPRIVPEAEPIPTLSFEELGQLSRVGTQVLHESAVEPVRVRHIPLQIRSTFRPDLPGTLIRTRHDGASGIAGFAGRRRMAMAAHPRCAARAPAEALRALGEEPFCLSETLGQTTVLLDMGSGRRNGHAGRASARAAAGGGGHAAGESCGARGDLPHVGRHPARAAGGRICRCAGAPSAALRAGAADDRQRQPVRNRASFSQCFEVTLAGKQENPHPK